MLGAFHVDSCDNFLRGSALEHGLGPVRRDFKNIFFSCQKVDHDLKKKGSDSNRKYSTA